MEAGRAEGLALRFDPDSDLAVSARHARFEFREGAWWIVDLDSRNGTWVDGARIDGARPVGPGRRIRFGWEGPEVEVVAVDLLAHARRNRIIVGALGVVVVGLAAVAYASSRGRATDAEAWERERAALVARTDSVLEAGRAAVDRLQGEVDGLGEALATSRARVEDLQAELDELNRSGRPDPARLADLRTRIDEAAAVVSGQEQAAAMDAAALVARVRPAVVMVFVEWADGGRSVASGFAVSPDGGVVTNRHVVAGEDGRRRPVRLGVQFSGSPQVWPADLTRTDEGDDLALLRIRNLVGGNPTVPEVNPRPDTLPAGSPVLLVGFPNAAPASPGEVPRALATAGSLTRLAEGRLEIDGWGAEGASGSPVVDASGRLVGVVYGAVGGADDRRLVAVPGDRLRAFLDGN